MCSAAVVIGFTGMRCAGSILTGSAPTLAIFQCRTCTKCHLVRTDRGAFLPVLHAELPDAPAVRFRDTDHHDRRRLTALVHAYARRVPHPAAGVGAAELMDEDPGSGQLRRLPG